MRQRVILMACAWLASGCIATETPPPARGVVVNGPPPAPFAEPRPAPPAGSASSAWVAGYWHWTGMQYTWIPGHWESPPVGAAWRAPRYSTTNGAYVYEPGGWTGATRTPGATPQNRSAFR